MVAGGAYARTLWYIAAKQSYARPPTLSVVQAVRVVYVDNAAQTAAVWRAILVTDQPGGVLVKQDTIHLKHRFVEVLPPSHPLYHAFSAALSDIIIPVYTPDEEAHPQLTPKQRRECCRKYVPSGRIVLDGIKRLLDSFESMPGGTELVTPALR